MALFYGPNSLMYYIRRDLVDDTLDKGFCNHSNLKRLGEEDALDYQLLAFGGIRFRPDRDGVPYLFLGKQHFERIKTHGVEVGVLEKKEDLPLTYDEFEAICFKIRESNLGGMGYRGETNSDSNYVRPRIYASKTEHGVAATLGWQFEVGTSHLGTYYPEGRLFLNLDPGGPRRTADKRTVKKAKGANSIYPQGREIAKFVKTHGLLDQLMLDSNDKILDTTTANVFWMKGRKIYTPFLDERALSGITLQFILKVAEQAGFEVEKGVFTKSDLAEFDFMSQTGTAVGPLPTKIVKWDGGEIEYNPTSYSRDLVYEIDQAILERREFPVEGFAMF